MPSLACGYSIIAGALFVLFPAWTSAAVRATPAWAMPAGVSAWADTFFRSLGALIFTPTLEAGVLIAAALLLWSRTLLAAGTVGWLSGAYTAVTIQGLGADFYWLPASYNFFLTGMALGAVFLLPGRTSLLLAAVGGCGCAVLAAMLQHVAPGWAYLPISSVLAIWIGLGAVTISEDRTHFWRNYAHGFPPEEAWWREANWARRFGRRDPLLVVPLPGLVQVSQGFNGKLSHVGRWSHAVDLQRPPGDTEGASSIWGAPVTAPAAGVVERVRDGIADNAVGISNYADNWGNYVVIRLDQGGWALLAHLRCRSIEVKTGMRVEIGSRVGSAGNSGRSPIPHVHLQVQRGPEPGTPTIPFRIANYLSVDASPDSVLRWHSMSVPSEKAIIMASTPNPSIRSILSSLLFGTAVWVVDSEGTIPRAFRPEDSSRTLQVDVRADASGQHIFACGFAATMACSSDVDAWRVLELSHAAPPLFRLVALGAPSIPHAAKTGMVWEDLAPLNAGRAGRFGLEILPYLTQPFLRLRCTCRAAPALERDPLVIEMSPAAQGETLPVRVTSQFELLRGPVKVEALFPRGRVTYSLLSFEPGFSLRDA